MKRTELTEADYKGTGIKTLRVMATLTLISGIIGALAFIPTWNAYVNYHSEISIIGISYSIASLISGVFMQSVCLCIATIAEGTLIKTVAHERETEAKEKSETDRQKMEEEKEDAEE